MRNPVSALALAALLFGVSCEQYQSPPEPRLLGTDNATLTDVKAPLVIGFTKRIDPSTLRIKIARYDKDTELNLPDEDADPATSLELYFSRDGLGPPSGGTSELVDGRELRITFDEDHRPPVGPRLVAIIEPGLSDVDGNATAVRRRLVFGYEFQQAAAAATKFPSGYYFFLVNVEPPPIPVQIQLLGWLDVEAETGKFTGQLTNGDRNRTQKCPTECKSFQACRLLPSPECVPPSERAGTVDEFSDFVPNYTPPSGFSFAVKGFVQDQEDGTVSFGIDPVDVIAQQPPVTVQGVKLSASFHTDEKGVWRGNGSLSATQFFIGTSPSGEGRGTLDARSLTEAEVPPDIPKTSDYTTGAAPDE
jgi:hypothetical protein